MPEEEFIINVFCLIDDLFQHLFLTPVRTRGYEPTLSDSKVITIEIVGEWLGHHKDKGIWKYMTTRIAHKLLAYNLGVFLNVQAGRPAIQFENLVTA